MTTYAAAEAGLLAVVRGLDGFTADNTSRGDFRVLDAEGYTYSAVLTQAAPSAYSDRGEDGRGSHGRRQHRHQIRVTVAAKRGPDNEQTVYEGLVAQADALIARIELYPLLGGAAGVRRAQVRAASEVVLAGERATHMLKRIDVDVACEADWTPVETPR